MVKTILVILVLLPVAIVLLLALPVEMPAITAFIAQNQIGLGWAYIGLLFVAAFAAAALWKRR